MKRALIILTCCLAYLSLAACSGHNDTANIPESPSAAEAAASPSKQAEKKTSETASPVSVSDTANLPKVTEGVSKGDEWQYITMSNKAFTGYEKHKKWHDVKFDTSAWGMRKAPMGNIIQKGGGTELTPAEQISWNDMSDNLLLRRTFEVKNPSDYDISKMDIWYIGDAEVYINGTKVYSDKKNNKNKKLTSYASVAFDTKPKLIKGTNVIALRIRNSAENREFDMSLNKLKN